MPTIEKLKRLTPKVTLLTCSPCKSPVSTNTSSSKIAHTSSDTSHIDILPSEMCDNSQCITDSNFQLFNLSWDSIAPLSPKKTDEKTTDFKQECPSTLTPSANVSQPDIMKQLTESSILSNNVFKSCVFEIHIPK